MVQLAVDCPCCDGVAIVNDGRLICRSCHLDVPYRSSRPSGSSDTEGMQKPATTEPVVLEQANSVWPPRVEDNPSPKTATKEPDQPKAHSIPPLKTTVSGVCRPKAKVSKSGSRLTLAEIKIREAKSWGPVKSSIVCGLKCGCVLVGVLFAGLFLFGVIAEGNTREGIVNWLKRLGYEGDEKVVEQDTIFVPSDGMAKLDRDGARSATNDVSETNGHPQSSLNTPQQQDVDDLLALLRATKSR